MAYTLQTGRSEFKGGKTILASEHMQLLEAGATLDAKAFGAGYVELGTAIARNTTTGKFEPFTKAEGYDEFAILNIDLECDGVNDVVVGEVLIRASVYDAKLPANVTEEFKELTRPLIRYVKHV